MFTKYVIENNSSGIYIALIDDHREYSSYDKVVADLLNLSLNEYKELYKDIGYIKVSGCYFNSLEEAEKFCEKLITPALIFNKFSS